MNIQLDLSTSIDIAFDENANLIISNSFNASENESQYYIYRFNMPHHNMLLEWIFNRISGDTQGNMYYIIHKSDDLILDESGFITERNYIESHVALEDGSKNILLANNKENELKGGYDVAGVNYVLLVYVVGPISFDFSIGGYYVHELSLIHI